MNTIRNQHGKLSKKERILHQIFNQEIDCVPTIGGWILGAHNLAAIARISLKKFLKDPHRGAILAYQALDVDGMVQPVIPTREDQIRTGLVQEKDFLGIQPEEILREANQLPDNEKAILQNFDRKQAEAHYRRYFEKAFQTWGGIVPIPNFWEIGGHFPLYTDYGYTAFFMACALYPEAVGKIYWAKSIISREKAKILITLYREYALVPLMFCGEDICNNKGPMVSPGFLRKHYFPTVKMIIEPLVDAGVRLIHHCDGDVRPVIKDLIELGFSGFQGFQYELGIDLYELNTLKDCMGRNLLFFTGMNVSRTLPFGTLQDVRDEIDYFLDFSAGGRGIFLFTSNVAGVEVPPENIAEGYRYIKTWDPAQERLVQWRQWPWAVKHGIK